MSCFSRSGSWLGVVELDAGAGSNHSFDEFGEILHVGPHDYGLAGGEGFDGILPAFGQKTLPDQHDVGQVIPGAEFAGGVDDEGRFQRRRLGRSRFRSAPF